MRLVYSPEAIRQATIELANAINKDYKGHQIHLIGVLKGAFIFLADLIRYLEVPCSVDFVRLSSYGSGTVTSGHVKELLPLQDPIEGRHVIVVEEIVDSGTTLSKLLADLEARRPASLKVCTLVDKTGRREVEIPVHYRGFHLEDGFLLGYGLDLDERYRNLPGIYVMEEGDELP
ncbi:hypoxanthine phosphoribosyltransferase [Deferrisoma palaeochoriense]